LRTGQFRRGPSADPQEQLENVRNALDRMVAWRLMYPFNAEESKRFNRLAAQERRLLATLGSSRPGD
jgi:hypothetical protein